MRYEKPRAVGDLLKDFIRENNLEEGLFACEVLKRFRETIGPQATGCLKQISFNKGTIFCKCSSSVTRTQLFLRRQQILEEVNISIGKSAVNKIVIN